MFQTVVIGAGQAGLATGYYLKKARQSFVMLDKNEKVGDEWKNRYDSLVLFSPRMYSALPGLQIKGDPNGFPDKHEMVQYLQQYAQKFQLPLRLQTKATRVWKENGHFHIQTNNQVYKAENVIVASGPFQTPKIPFFSQNLSPDIKQLHSSQYKNPADLLEGNVLIVGGGNSGAQIAVEISGKRDTYLSAGDRMKFLPLKIGAKSIFWWLEKAGILNASRHSWMGRKIQASGDPIFGLELKKAMASGEIISKSKAVAGEKRHIQFQDQTWLEVQNIIWATGFAPDYSWLDIQGVLNKEGKPVHQRGITQIKGLYFIGLPWQHRRGSALLYGVGKDAQYITGWIQKETRIR